MKPESYPRSRHEMWDLARPGSVANVAPCGAGSEQNELALAKADDDTEESLSVWLDTVARIVCRVTRSSSKEGVC